MCSKNASNIETKVYYRAVIRGRVKHLVLSLHGNFPTACRYIAWFFTWSQIPIEMKPSLNQSRQSRQVLIQKWSKLLVRKMIKKVIEKSDRIRWLYLILSPPNLILSLDDWAKNKVSAYFKVGWSSIWTIFYTSKPQKLRRNNFFNFLYLDENIRFLGIRSRKTVPKCPWEHLNLKK